MSAPSAAPRSSRPGPSAAGTSWEDRLLDGVDRALQATMGPQPPRPNRKPGRPPKRGRGDRKPDGKGPFSSSWRKASAVEGIGIALLVLFVVVARPDSQAGPASGPDGFPAVATGTAADGSIRLSSGRVVHLLGVSLPTAQDAPLVRSASASLLDGLVRGRRVYVEFDPVLPSTVQEGQPTTVAYVWVIGSDGRRKALVNSALLARGLARPVTSIGFGRQSEFVRAATIARSREAGVWRPTAPELGGLVAPF